MKCLSIRLSIYVRFIGRFPFDQIFRFEIPGILCYEWNSIFRFVGLTNPRSSGSKFRAKIRYYSWNVTNHMRPTISGPDIQYQAPKLSSDSGHVQSIFLPVQWAKFMNISINKMELNYYSPNCVLFYSQFVTYLAK